MTGSDKMKTGSNKATVTVIIPNYNGESYLADCLGSLLKQSFNAFEIVVADNASTDRSLLLLKSDFPMVRTVTLANNKGFAAAINAGLEIARGEYIVFLNNDTRVDPDFIRELVSALGKEPEADMAAPKMLFARDSEIVNSMGLGYSITGSNHDIGFGLKDSPSLDRRDWIFGPCGGAGIYRRAIFQEIGNLDNSFFMYYEDIDLCFRAQLAGYKCISAPASRVFHAEGGSGALLPKPRNYFFARNSLTVILKNYPIQLILKYFHVLIWEITKRSLSPLRKGDLSAIRGYCAAILRLGDTLKKRREIQNKIRIPIADIEEILLRNRSVLSEIDLQGRPAEESR